MIKPLRDYVVLEKLPEEKKVGSIFVATATDKDSACAKVVSVGPGTVDEKGNKVEIHVKAGQLVIYKKYSTTDYEEKGHKFMLIQDKDIIAIVDNK